MGVRVLCSLAVLAVVLISNVESHGYIRRPMSRTSIFLLNDQNGYPYREPYWWDHLGVWCGNQHQNLAVSTCGRCGDAPGETSANQGGAYDKGHIVANYTSGSAIDIEVEYGAGHFGSFQIELCPQQNENDNCFQLLNVLSASENIRIDNRVCVPHGEEAVIRARVQLPNVRCDRCTLRWTHRTSYPGWSPYDICHNPNPTQTFRNCVDIAIR